MRIRVSLQIPVNSRIPTNHQDALAAVIYRLLASSDTDYSSFLHDEGYGLEGSSRRLKLFCFSWVRARGARVDGAWLYLPPGRAEWMISSPVEPFLQHCARGLLAAGRLRITNVPLAVTQVETVSAPDFTLGRLPLRCLSPIVASVHRTAERGQPARYLVPADGDALCASLHANLVHKHRVLHGRDHEGEPLRLEFDEEYLRTHRGGTKLMTANSTQVRGSFAPFVATGSPALLQIGYECGFGEKNSGGFGMVEVRGE